MSKLMCDAVISRNNKWYYGRLNGFQFNIIKEVKEKDDLTSIDRFESASNFMKSIGYNGNFDKLTRALMKNIVINDWTLKDDNAAKNRYHLVQIGKGTTRLFLANVHKNPIKYNFICEQCSWGCKQMVNTQLVSCKSFKEK